MFEFLHAFAIVLCVAPPGTTPVASTSSTARAEPKEDADDDAPFLQEVVGTEVVYPQERGEWQFTLGSEYEYETTGGLSATGAAIELGLTDAWQVEVAWDAVLVAPRSDGVAIGVGDLEVATKYSFMRLGGTPLSAAVGFELGVPTASRRVTGERGVLEYQPFVILSTDAGAHLHLFTNVALVASRDGIAPEGTVGAIARVSRLRPSATLGWRDDGLLLTPGLNLVLPRTWEIGVGAPFGLVGDAPRFAVAAFVLFEFDAW